MPQYFSRVPQDEYDLFVSLADKRGETPSSLLRRIVRLWLATQGVEPAMRERFEAGQGRLWPRKGR